ncbi:MAG: beta-galactosidase GalA [Fimbriimonas sp.]
MITAILGALLVAPPPIQAGPSPRERIRFDANWRFLRDTEGPVQSPRGPFAWQWKPADAQNLNVDSLPTDLTAGDWKATQLGENVLNGNRQRFAWYRTELGNDVSGAEKVLEFESVDDNAVVFLNGKRLYRHVGFGTPFKVPVREAWQAGGPNTLVVLVENTAAGGGINGGVELVLPRAEVVPDSMRRVFDDSKWRTVHLPHDYVVEGTFDPRGDVSHGTLPKPLGFYRKTFVPPLSMRGKSVWIDFDGIYRNAAIYLNGEKLGDHSSGYIGVRYDLSKRLDYGRPNVIAIRVDPRRNEGWWYEGGGIYRHVWLNVASPVHVAPDGTFARAKVQLGSAPSAEVRVTTTLRNEEPSPANVTVRWQLIDPGGKVVSRPALTVTVPANGTSDIENLIPVASAQLWDLATPRLYKIATTVTRGGQTLDTQTTRFGIRDIKWDKDRGFLLNGRVVKLQGTCNHQDHAGVGVAMPDGLQEWRIRKLLEMGSNAYRCSHNPTSPEFMDLCDELGMLVLDETRHLGDSTLAKSPAGTTADDLGELKALILRDRNHPSVIAWCLYNEENLQGTPQGAEIFRKMTAVADRLDGTRLTTGANNYGFNSGIQLTAELYGYNYNIGEYDRGRARFPNQILFGSETASAVSTRGIYANDPVKGYVSAYDVNHPSWGATAEAAWKPIAERPWLAGGFVWTGFDYKGEPTPYGWPCINSHFGIIDIAGFPKDSYYYYQAWWKKAPIVHLLPHWNWSGKEGQPIRVWAHSNADRVELRLNGKSLGTKEMPRLSHLEWDVPYEPGTLEAIGYRGNAIIARDKVETAGAPAAIRLKTDRRKILADHEDLTIVQVEILDAKGRIVPTASNLVQFSVEGAATIGGVGNGDPSDHDPDKADRRKAFNGLCMALVQSNGKKGRITFRATSAGLKGASMTLSADGGIVSQ